MTDWLSRARVREAAAHRRQYHARKRQGLCPCGRERDGKFVKCARCREAVRRWRKENAA